MVLPENDPIISGMSIWLFTHQASKSIHYWRFYRQPGKKGEEEKEDEEEEEEGLVEENVAENEIM